MYGLRVCVRAVDVAPSSGPGDPAFFADSPALIRFFVARNILASLLWTAVSVALTNERCRWAGILIVNGLFNGVAGRGGVRG